MKAGNRAAGHGDETERKDFACKNRTRTIRKASERRQQHLRMRRENSKRQRQDRAQLDEGAQVIARRQQQPYRQHARRSEERRVGKEGRSRWALDDYEEE